MRNLRSGREENLPYSLSRWTDVPAAKWDWFKESLREGFMEGFDPRTGVPSKWSLAPEDTLGLVFWTKDPWNLVMDQRLPRDFKVKIHVTVTGWEEVEKGAPTLLQGASGLKAASVIYGPENVTWRFSPVPLVPNVVERFGRILVHAADAGLKSVFLSFLQTNDLMAETRTDVDRLNILVQIAELGEKHGVKVLLCNEDRLLIGHPDAHANLASGICAPPEDFFLAGREKAPSEGCGCVLMVDPFTINETCTMGCKYCYAADVNLADKKRNTTKRSLPLVR
jgi:hypothetical protein